MSPSPEILGVILAGGRARRLGGGDKGLQDLDGKPVLAHVVARFQPQVQRLILNANGDATRFARFGLEVVADGEFPDQGPLSGILAALDWAAHDAPDVTAIATVSTDVPFLPKDLIARLDAARGDANTIAIAISAGCRHPTIALWPTSVRPQVADALARGVLGVDALAARLNAVAVPFPMREISGEAVDPFFNVNTPEDLAIARALCSQCQER